MKTSTGRKAAIAALLTLLLASSALTVGRTIVPPLPTPPTPTPPSCARVDDATLANNVRDALAKVLSARVMDGIQVTAKHRVVTLSGDVNFKPTRARAVALARKVACVRRVINEIKFRIPTEECTGGQQECCCPEEGCVCARACTICGLPKPPKPTPGHRRGRR
jgi:hypothetical protein